MQRFRYHALILTLLVAISVLAAGGYYCEVEIKDPVKGIDVLVENCSNIGTFSMGGIYDGRWERLTYNYPMPWRGTFFSIKVTDKVYSNSIQPKDTILLDNYVTQYPRVSDNKISTVWRLPENLVVEQTIEVLEDNARVRTSVTNDNSNSLWVGLRLHLDTMIGDNDGAPIYIQGDGLQTSEKEYPDTLLSFKHWDVYEQMEDSEIVSTGAILDDGLVHALPNRLILANWKRSMRSSWEYVTDSSIPITGDSAVILYYPEEQLLPGETREVAFGYGRGKGVEGIIEGPTIISVVKELRIEDVVADKNVYCPGDPITIDINLENLGMEDSGTVEVKIKDGAGKTSFIERKETGILKQGWSGAIRFRWKAVDLPLRDFTVIATLYDSDDKEIDRESTSIRIDRLSCPQQATGVNLTALGILLALILAIVSYTAYKKMPHGKVEIRKVKEGDLSRVIVWNKTNRIIRDCVLHDKVVKGAEVSVSTINVHRHGNSLTWNIGDLASGEDAVLEYMIKGVNVLPKAKLSWDGGEVEST